MSVVLLVRHASCEGLGVRLNGRDEAVRLTPSGRAEAERLAARLERLSPARIMTSPRTRCRETAEAIASRACAPVQTDADLDEVDFGAWTGLEFERLNGDAGWREWNRRRSAARAPGGECMADVQRRTMRAVESALRGSDIVVLVSHAEPIRAVIAGVLGFSMDAWARLDISPAGVTRLMADPLRLGCVNETAL